MRRKFVLSILAAAAVCLWGARTRAIAKDVKSPDEHFMRQADQIDLTEVKLGKIAQVNGSAATVKAFGERMIRDHSRMNQDLRTIAKEQGIMLPKRLDRKNQQLVDELSALKGSAFDRAYAKDMVPGHKEAVATFENEVATGHIRAVKSWADKWCPTLEEHLRMAEKTVKSLGTI
jgi:putative membrane protein